MKTKRLINRIVTIVILLCAISFSLYTFAEYKNLTLLYLEAITVVLFILFLILKIFTFRKYEQNMVVAISDELNLSGENSVSTFPMPVIVINAKGDYVWFNRLFLENVMQDEIIKDEILNALNEKCAVLNDKSVKSTNIEFLNRYYTVFCNHIHKNEKTYYAYIFDDNTDLEALTDEFNQSKPNVILISIDGIDELQYGYKEGERDEIRGVVEKMLEDWIVDYSCLIRRLSGDRFIIVSQERHLQDMCSKKFSILKQVREYTYKGKVTGITLSIGVGRGNNLEECETNAQQAMELSLGRGGDQCTVKNKDMTFNFYGGVNRSIEKKTKVKTRIMAKAISELIKASDIVIIMGHRYSDFDVFGSAAALSAAANAHNRKAYIALDINKTLSISLIESMRKEGAANNIISIEEALNMITNKTLLIVVDTHIPDFCESRELYEKAQFVAVVDHHRLAVNHIKNAVVFYHNNTASSTSEMVSELIQYMSATPLIGKAEAEGLLAGIMLDTRNFVIRTTVRTFDAAAYVKSLGADTINVKRLFSSDFNSHKLRNHLIMNAEVYRECAISIADFTNENIRVICAQTADEMLNITDVRASFVLFEANGNINISARSYGGVNVQLLMESLGGGGHMTMAAAQFDAAETPMEAAVKKLHSIIDEYFENL